MYTKQEIVIQSYRDGKSQRTISSELGISRKTVKKYLKGYEDALSAGCTQELAHAEYLSTAPIYQGENRTKQKLTTDVESEIDRLLLLNEEKKRAGLKKQLLKKKDILHELHRQDIDIGYTTVCNYISSKRTQSGTKEAYIRQVYDPGGSCEFDWGEIKIYIADKLTRLNMSVFTSAYSNYRDADIFNRQNTISFQESHVNFFRDLGGVFRLMVYDNMRVAVAKFVGPSEKEPTRALLQMRGHYSFSHRFCNIYRGNEKGHVERSVEYVRRKAFGLKDHFRDIEEARAWLKSILYELNSQVQSLTNKTAFELLKQERPFLGKLPESDLECTEQVSRRPDKYATISHQGNRYSVPDHLVGKFLEVYISSYQVVIYDDKNIKVASHQRCYEKQQWVINIEHYLETFKKKPGALPGSLALADNVYLKSLYTNYFQGEPRRFIELLDYCRNHKITNEKLEESVKRLLRWGNESINAEKLQALLGNKETEIQKPAIDQICLISKQQLSILTQLMY